MLKYPILIAINSFIDVAALFDNLLGLLFSGEVLFFEILERLLDNIEFIFGESCALAYPNSLSKIFIAATVRFFKGVIFVFFSEFLFDKAILLLSAGV